MRLHEDAVDVDVPLVRRVVAAQFPHLAGLAVTAVRSTGTVNAIFRLGTELTVRLPLVERHQEDLAREQRWLPVLGPRVSLAVPQPVAAGRPGNGYPFSWAIYRWIEGRPYGEEPVDERTTAGDLAAFVGELRSVDPVPDAPPAGRRPLRELDEVTREAIVAAADLLDAAALLAAWDRALGAPGWDGRGVWMHGDLLPPNLLVGDGRLRAVIDFGSVGVGDPAADVVPAWSVFGPPGRSAYREALDVPDGTWARARGYALHQAALIVPYYRETNPAFVAMARRTLEQVLTDG